MKILVLVRHATAVPELHDGTLTDHQRFLTPEGNKEALATAKAISDFWTQKSLMPPSIIASSATRAKQTAESIADEFLITSMRLKDSLYSHPKEHWIKIIKASDASSNALVMVSHNPVISELASSYLDRPVNLSPADYIIVQFDGNWADVDTSPWVLLKSSVVFA